MDRPQAGGYNIYEIALSLRKTDVVSVTRVSNCGPQRMSLLTRFGRVFAKFFQKPQQCQPFVFRKFFSGRCRLALCRGGRCRRRQAISA